MGTSGPAGHSPKPHSLTVEALMEMIFCTLSDFCLYLISISSKLWWESGQWENSGVIYEALPNSNKGRMNMG